MKNIKWVHFSWQACLDKSLEVKSELFLHLNMEKTIHGIFVILPYEYTVMGVSAFSFDMYI